MPPPARSATTCASMLKSPAFTSALNSWSRLITTCKNTTAGTISWQSTAAAKLGKQDWVLHQMWCDDSQPGDHTADNIRHRQNKSMSAPDLIGRSVSRLGCQRPLSNARPVFASPQDPLVEANCAIQRPCLLA